MYSDSGWHQVQHEGKTFVIKKTYDMKVVKFIASDLVEVWVKEMKDDEILNLFRSLNPLIECSDCSIIHKMIKDSLLEENGEDHPSSVEVVVLDNNFLELKFRTRRSRLQLKLDISVRKGTPQTFYNEMTLPLLLIAEELLARQNHLCLSLAKKDNEIAQYKLEGAVLTRTVVETQPFSKDEFLSKCHAQNTSSLGKLNAIKFLNLQPNIPTNESEIVADNPSSSSSQPNPNIKTKDIKRDLDSEENVDTVAAYTTNLNSDTKVPLKKKKKPIKLNL